MVNGNCAIVGCKNSNYRLKKWRKLVCELHNGNLHEACPCPRPFSLHRFPSEKMNSEQRKEWIRKINRVTSKNKPWTPGESDMVCSKHFADGCPTQANPIPTLDLGYDVGTKKARRVLLRHTVEDETAFPEIEALPIYGEDSDAVMEEDESDAKTSCINCGESKLRILSLEKEVGLLQAENCKLRRKVNELSKQKHKPKAFSCEEIRSDSKMKFYTGIQTVALFNMLFDLIKPCLPSMVYWRGTRTVSPSKYIGNKKRRNQKVPLRDQFLLVLMRLRLGLMNEDLADRFRISPGVCSNIFTTWIKMLAALYGKALVRWLPRDVIRSNLPDSFKKISPKTRCIIDCTEIFMERSKSLHVQASTWSDYKKHNTLKVLVAISPHGYIMFLSSCYGGRTSDQFICSNSGLFHLLDPGDEVMADRGFQIKEDLLHFYCSLNVPPGARVKSQMTSYECKKTRMVANLRIHVERAINRIKEFKIIKNIMPINMLPLADDIIQVCAALCNIQPPLIKIKEDK